ncbi:MAG: hypothetical protein HN742_09520 [Lentisphaerae bacterium]|nr:hypothetical protein [Lentisphaerota bacterium]MBT5606729.1 hypothetical protein [Lentisphaerota bacterium]MBT7056968.1 hypothetical protein [Lentisphaerota bacterium]MBT7842101.1 hypothetical protein [Lentisphaerota bacterium]
MSTQVLEKQFHVEILSPRQKAENLEADLERFATRYTQAIAGGDVVCIPDNPLGKLAFQGTELIRELGLPAAPGQVSVHINTFHTKQNLDEVLGEAVDLGIDNVLVISGDGSERLPKLRAQDLGMDAAGVTSVELVQYVHREYAGAFSVGVAFNPYEPQEHEWEKLQRKVDAGADFITTQPIIGRHECIGRLQALGLPVVVEAWMSKKLHLLSDCVGYKISEDTPYDPWENLIALRNAYPECSVYLALLGFKTQLPQLAQLKEDMG